MDSITLNANAKVNLSLDVIGKRPDGYHLLEMVMQSISLHDTITISKISEPVIQLTCNVPNIPCDARNIAYRSAALFFQYCNLSCGVAIHLEKRIPSQAGLGGGSADGAAVFVGLNHLFETNLSTETLCHLGVQIGADVPFCIVGGTQLCEGIGEKMTPVSPMPSCPMVLCKPNISVNTGEAYRQIDHGIIKTHPNTDALCNAIGQKDIPKIGSLLCNVFESAIPLPQVDDIKLKMKKNGAVGACMSGSGSTVFSLFSHRDAAENCAAQLKTIYPDVFIAEPATQGILICSV